MASGEAERLQYTTTVLRVSIHCEGCKKKVKKVLQNIEGVYKVTVDAAQHKVTVTGSLGSDALIKRLHKAGKQAALWPAAPTAAPPAAVAKKPEEVAPARAPAGEGCVKDKGAEAKPKEAASKDKGSSEKKQPEAEGKEKNPEKEKGLEKKAEATKPKDDESNKDAEVTAPSKEKKGSPEPANKEPAAAAAAEEEGAVEEPGSGKKGKKKKKKQQKEGGEPETPVAAEKTPSQPSTMPPAPAPERPLGGGFAYYAAAQPVMSYNVAHPSSSVSYYAPTPVGPMPASPPPPYGYPAMMVPAPLPPMPEYMYGPPGIRSPPQQESYNNMFNEDNANSCTVM